MNELGLTAVRVRDLTRVATARARALDKNKRIEEDMTKPPPEIVELRERGFSDDQILRLLKLKMLEVRGLVIRETLPDGSAILDYPQPDHPEVKAFLEAASDGICGCACCGKGPTSLAATATRTAASRTGLRAKSNRTKRKVAGSRNGRR
jgi:hypothetical protein